MADNLVLDLADASERLLPPRFKFRRYQPVLRISRVILPECPVGSIACSLKIALEGVTDLVTLAGHIAFRLGGGGNGPRFDHPE